MAFVTQKPQFSQTTAIVHKDNSPPLCTPSALPIPLSIILLPISSCGKIQDILERELNLEHMYMLKCTVNFDYAYIDFIFVRSMREAMERGNGCVERGEGRRGEGKEAAHSPRVC